MSYLLENILSLRNVFKEEIPDRWKADHPTSTYRRESEWSRKCVGGTVRTKSCRVAMDIILID